MGKNTGKIILSVAGAVTMLLVFSSNVLAQIPVPSPAQEAIGAKSSDIARLEQEIGAYEREIAGRRTQQRTLNNEIAIFTAQEKKAQLEIRRLSLLLGSLADDIELREESIVETEGDIGVRRDIMERQLRLLSQEEEKPSLLLFVAEGKFSDFFIQLNAIQTLHERVFAELLVLRSEKQELELERAELVEKRSENEELKYVQETTRDSLRRSTAEKQRILSATKCEDKKFQQ
ncbi:MAG: hypothetical protein EHJ95_06780 [Methanobacteriota archaeon]|nr:MAG: hypothetical protein EHJ95_06780 [Euryarchaeota archaeon]